MRVRTNSLRSLDTAGNGIQDEGEWNGSQPFMLLAGDIGGTKTLLGLFDQQPSRPRAILIRAFTTLDFPDLNAMIAAFADESGGRGAGIATACFGVAGPVINDTAELTNVPWRVDAPTIGRAFGIPRVLLLNDLQATAYAVPVLHGDELHTLQAGKAVEGGDMALIAAGTGLGQALLHRVDGRFVSSPSEAGHADWGARNEREISVLRSLIHRFGRAEVEQVVSGQGLVNLHRVTHPGACPAVEDADDPDAPAAISRAALERTCERCMEALSIFVDAYGAEAGNVALRSMATGGVFISGGIAPKILPALVDGRFMRAFLEKAPLDGMLSRVPVKVVLNTDAGLLGAAVHAAAARA
ncbi:MAG: glucokinase [Luteitalea sp.]|nr:glucokinase [Luteitalea sp.]